MFALGLTLTESVYIGSIVFFWLVHPVQFNRVQFFKTLSIRYNFAKTHNFLSCVLCDMGAEIWKLRRRRKFRKSGFVCDLGAASKMIQDGFAVSRNELVLLAYYLTMLVCLVHPVQFDPVQFSKTLSIQYNFAKLYRIPVQKKTMKGTSVSV